MTDKKLTDKEIVKALECCSEEDKCKECPYYNKGNFKCLNYKFFKDLLDLINRLQAENERLKNAYKQVAWERDCFEADNKRLYEIIENKNIKTEEQ